MATLESLVTTFKASASSLGSDLLYQGRTVSTVGDAATVEALDGVSIQSFDLEISQLAEQDIVQSGSFSKSDALFANNTGTMSIAVGGKSYDINYKANQTLEDLVQNINDKLDGKVTAKIMQVGDEDYRMILSSDETGTSNKIILTDGSGNLKDSLSPYDATMIAPSKVANNASGSEVTINAADITLNGINLNSDITIPTGASSSSISKLFKDAINEISDQTGVTANVVTKDGSEFLYLTNVDGTLVDEDITLTGAGDVTAYSGLTDDTVAHHASAETTTIQDAVNSKLNLWDLPE